MLKHQIPVIFLNERNAAQLLCYSKEDDVQHMVKVTLSVRIPSRINHLKLFIKNISPSKAFVPSGNLLLSCYFFGRGLVYNFLCLYLTSARGLQMNSVILP